MSYTDPTPLARLLDSALFIDRYELQSKIVLYACVTTGFPVKNDPLYNHVVFGPEKGRGGVIGKTDEQLIHDLINIHNAENWLGMDGDSELMPVLKDVDDEGKKTPPGM